MKIQRNSIIMAGALLLSYSPITAFQPPNRRNILPSRHDSVLPREHEISMADPYDDAPIQTVGSGRTAITKQSKKKTKQKYNAALSDPEFVRKRTDILLQADSDEATKSKVKNDKKTFDWLIDAWAYSNQSDSAEMALSLLNRMEQLHSLGNERVAPDSKTYTKVIHAIARSGQICAGTQAEALLKKMIDDNHPPTTLTYTYVIDAYSRSSSEDAPHHAQRLIEAMEAARQSGLDVKPTARAYNSVIQSWATTSASRANACLDTMEKLADSTGNEEVRPNFYNCNSVISAWAKSGEAGSAAKAELILEKMERMYRDSGNERFKPRTETYNAIIDAWAKSGEVDAPHRAELLLGYMMELYETGHNVMAKPNVRSFNSVMNAWAKSGDIYAPERAVDILKNMEEMKRSGDLKIVPDATSYATAINAYARSLNYGKADAAYELYQRMNKLYHRSGNDVLRPNNIVYNSVLNACAFTIGDIEEQCRAIEIANYIFTAMSDSKGKSPDEVTYGTYLKVICNQMPRGKQRNKVVNAIFEKAASDGMVGTLVFRQMKETGLDATSCQKYFGRESIDSMSLDDLPISWTRNVIKGKQQQG